VQPLFNLIFQEALPIDLGLTGGDRAAQNALVEGADEVVQQRAESKEWNCTPAW
jgi:hypothetical protein